MQVINAFSITSNSDMTEGRGFTIIHGYCRNKADALAIVNDKRFYGKFGTMGCAPYDNGKFDVGEVAIRIFESAADFFNYDKDALKKQALAKLTPEERDALGLK